MDSGRFYCIDTSELTSAFYRNLPAKNFGALWERVSDFIEEGRLVAPIAVYKELQYQQDDLYDWVKARKDMFVEPDAAQINFTYQIGRDFPSLARKHSSANPADPWVIALAKTQGLKVLSGEKPGSMENPKIPFICRKYGIRHGRFIDIVVAEGWTFP